MKIAIVVQRFGTEIVGGAEAHAATLATQLFREYETPIEVITTTAKSYQTWQNEYPEGLEKKPGLRVRRFNSDAQRARWFSQYNRLATPLIKKLGRYAFLKPLAVLLEKIWFSKNASI